MAYQSLKTRRVVALKMTHATVTMQQKVATGRSSSNSSNSSNNSNSSSVRGYGAAAKQQELQQYMAVQAAAAAILQRSLPSTGAESCKTAGAASVTRKQLLLLVVLAVCMWLTKHLLSLTAL
jgi:hypothetical protein